MNGVTGYRLLVGLSLLLFLSVLPSLPFAAEPPGFVWNLGTQLGYDDNVYRTVEGTEESDSLFVLQPSLGWQTLYSKHLFELGYQGEYGFYKDETDLNYFDHHILAHALLDHSHRLNSEYHIGYRWGLYHPGETDDFEIIKEEPDKWQDGYFDTSIIYGRSDSKGQLIGQLEYHRLRFDDSDQEFRDYDKLNVTGVFFYRIAPKTRLLLEVSFSDYNYKHNDSTGSNQTNKEYRYLTGVTWEATAKTTGIFKIGYRDKSYDDDRFSDLSGLALWLDAIWEPNTYTRVTLGATRENRSSARESTGGFIRQSLSAGLNHDITRRTTLVADASYGKDRFENNSNREDDRWELRLGANHSLRRWLDVGIEYRFEERDSNRDEGDFKSNVFMLIANTTFGD